MDLGLHKRRRHQVVETSSLSSIYPHDLSLFSEPPGSNIQLREFEDLAIDRLKLLRSIEYISNKGLKPFSTEWKTSIIEEAQKQNLKRFVRLLKSKGTTNPTELDYQARRADHISHYILRLAYCRSAELRKWFLNKEMDLFKMRFMELTPQAIVDFFKINKLHYDALSEEEKFEYREDLVGSTAGHYTIETTTFYKVPFLEVINLIKQRKVFVNDGVAYVPSFEMVACITTKYRAELNGYLAYACRRLPEFDDDRILDIINNLNQVYTGDDYREPTDKNEISLLKVDEYARKHFPLCMRNIHEVLRSAHHLKHGCRLSYTLFLKAIGVTLEDCLRLWREEFTKLIPEDKFEKQYAYNIKHGYGKVGRMVNYAPLSCMKIISTTVGSGEQHGCPYKHWDGSFLKKKLEDIGITEKYVNEITDYSKKGHYQLACGKYFEAMHCVEAKNAIIHPNQYFQESFDMNNDKGKDVAPKKLPSKVNTASNSQKNSQLSQEDLDMIMDEDF